MLLIAGIDSGTNFAFSLINLDGELLYLNSGKKLEEKILEICLEIGKVIAITTDKRKSKKVKKLATSLSAEVVLPKKDLSKYKKSRLIKDFKNQKLNSHEKSSLSAALFAYSKYKQKLKKFEDKFGPVPLSLKEEFILSGKRVSYFKYYSPLSIK